MPNIEPLMKGKMKEKEFWQRMDLFILRLPGTKVKECKIRFYTDQLGDRWVEIDKFTTY